jgi:hypothetical protein
MISLSLTRIRVNQVVKSRDYFLLTARKMAPEMPTMIPGTQMNRMRINKNASITFSVLVDVLGAPGLMNIEA